MSKSTRHYTAGIASFYIAC